MDRWAIAENRELRAMVELTGRQAEVESGALRLEVEARDPPATVMLEDGRPTELTPYRWWAEGEQRGCQMTAVEETGAGGKAGICEHPGFQDWTGKQEPSLGWTGKQKPTLV